LRHFKNLTAHPAQAFKYVFLRKTKNIAAVAQPGISKTLRFSEPQKSADFCGCAESEISRAFK